MTHLGSFFRSYLIYLSETIRDVCDSGSDVESLKEEFAKLRLVRDDVQGMAAAASGRGEVITNRVKEWIRRADEIEKGLRILEDQSIEEKASFKFLTSFSSSYRISEQAVRMIDDINDLCRESNITMISYSPHLLGRDLMPAVVPNSVEYEENNIARPREVFGRRSNRIESSNTLHPNFDEIIEEIVKMYSPQNLNDITDNFKERLGRGGFGVVYKGKVEDGMLVAVKILNGNVSDSLFRTQFKAEVNSIGRTNHFNLVRLCGFCFEEQLKALVFEFMENGSLDGFLFDDEKRNSIGWEAQQSIAVGTAKGIAYLHEDCRDKIIHYDIKPGNVLLDGKLCPKVADFGLAKLCSRDATHITKSGFRGTDGYAAPEMYWPHPLTTKCDVYSFGVLLFEILGKRKHYETKALPGQEDLPRWVWKTFEEGALGETLLGFGIEENDMEEAGQMAMVALWCVGQQPERRPSMSSVVMMLEGDVKPRRPPNPFSPHYSSTA
ncbi:G-type lectin S-receptor-like serine/threonine-protein kinase At1g34300 [Tasmannia lanceolata]|uniref:G-type lectin S-receptor-like serine/threonine-protein kinase At1g34300 n=1 Tax=Tasmannia lanceolata TaxID=3420 RepID=UPI0040636049